MKTNNIILKIIISITYFAMVTVNYLANALPIGGITTGEASASYANLFTPAGITFSIWGLIYLLLLGHILYQFGLWQKGVDTKREEKLAVVGRYFLATSIANIAWIFTWHYRVIWLSVGIMLSLLYFLIRIADIINKEHYTVADMLFIRLPFSVYFAWITVATIANITVLLVRLKWDGFGVSDAVWTIIILLAGTGIAIARMVKDRDIIFGFVFVWAYSGILLKHLSENGFGGQYPGIVSTVIVCMVLFIITIVFLWYKNRTEKKFVKSSIIT